jgi:hypothetical protein
MLEICKKRVDGVLDDASANPLFPECAGLPQPALCHRANTPKGLTPPAVALLHVSNSSGGM